jgi:hypothetical protein
MAVFDLQAGIIVFPYTFDSNIPSQNADASVCGTDCERFFRENFVKQMPEPFLFGHISQQLEKFENPTGSSLILP